MTVMEVCHYGKTDIKFGFHRFRPILNFFVSMENFLSEIVSFHYLLKVWVIVIQNQYLLMHLVSLLIMYILFMVVYIKVTQ